MPSAADPSQEIGCNLVAGLDHLSGWADLLDAINVYPVADGDTGHNLLLSLAPLRRLGPLSSPLADQLLMAARGNSGNIANRFFSSVVMAHSWSALHQAMQNGYAAAAKAIANPMAGTMLTALRRLTDLFAGVDAAPTEAQSAASLTELAATVRRTAGQLPELEAAGVVDAGALGIYLFMVGFYDPYLAAYSPLRSVQQQFHGLLKRKPTFRGTQPTHRWCVDIQLNLARADTDALKTLTAGDESAVVTAQGDRAKIHVHTQDLHRLKNEARSLGTIVTWHQEDMVKQAAAFVQTSTSDKIHIMTDAAGSVTPADARDMGLSLLSSYLNIGQRSLPETLVAPDQLYEAMRAGVAVGTAQASDLERQACYQRCLCRHDYVVYLCVGSAYTGTVQAALHWKARPDPDNRVTVIDSGAASGRLGIAALASAQVAREQATVAAVVRFAQRALSLSKEYIFLDRLKYLAAGGRLSRTSAFLGDAIHLKPVVSPLPDGARKVAVVKNRHQQCRLALEKLKTHLTDHPESDILLQYSDNRPWLEKVVLPQIRRRYGAARILIRPISLTSGAHMGPGTWALAFLDRQRAKQEARL